MMFELNGFQRDLLVCIAGLDHPSGQRIRDELEETTTLGEVTHGQLYPNLDTLVEEGLVERGELDRRTNYYAITKEGNKRIQQYKMWIEHTISKGQDDSSESVQREANPYR